MTHRHRCIAATFLWRVNCLRDVISLKPPAKRDTVTRNALVFALLGCLCAYDSSCAAEPSTTDRSSKPDGEQPIAAPAVPDKAADAATQEEAVFQRRLDTALDEYNRDLKKSIEELLQSIDDEFAKATTRGDIEAAKQCREATAALRERGSPPEVPWLRNARKRAERDVTRARAKLSVEFDAVAKKTLKEGNLEQAEQIIAEKARLLADSGDWRTLKRAAPRGDAQATNIIGAGGGQDFLEKAPNNASLVGVTVYANNWVHGIQAIYRMPNGKIALGAIHGSRGGRTDTFTLKPGEHLTGIIVRNVQYIDSIRFQTNKGLSKPFGGPNDTAVEVAVALPGGAVTVGVTGRAGEYLHAIGLVYETTE